MHFWSSKFWKLFNSSVINLIVSNDHLCPINLCDETKVCQSRLSFNPVRGRHTGRNSCIGSFRECGLQCCIQNFARNHCQYRLPALFDFRPQFMPASVLLQTSRGEVAHADVAAVASYQLFSGFRCNSAAYWNFTLTWDWHKYSQMYLNTKYLTKGNWIVNTKWKSIELPNNYSRKCKYISDTL